MEIQGECPSCRHPNRKYYFNPEKQIGDCKHCGYNGRSSPALSSLDTFVEPSRINAEYVRQTQVALMENRAALSYLMNDRALKLESIKHFRLGYEPSSSAFHPAIVIPHTDLDNKVCGIKYRHIDPDVDPKYISVKGSRPFIYNSPVLLSTRFPWIVITEGELDCISLLQLASQLPVIGFPGMTYWKDRWLKWFERFERIYIAFDREDRASEEAEKLARILKDYRCYRVKTPEGIKDVNEMLVTAGQEKGLKIWKQLMSESKCIGVPLIKETREYIEEVKDHYFGKGMESVSTGFPALDSVMGGLSSGRVYLLKGNTGLGKTTFALHILLNVAQAGGKVLLGSFEMKVAEEMLLKVLSKLLGRDLSKRDAPLTPAQLHKIMEGVSQYIPVSWINRHDRLRMGELYDAVKIEYARGYRFLFLDHAQFMMNLGKEDAVYSETAKISKFIKRLTNDFPELVILMITELNAQEGTFGGKSLEYDSDVVLSYFGTGMEVQKHRVDSGYKGRKVQIRWDQARSKYTVF